MEEERKLCPDCQSFYGVKATEFRCSSCYKKYLEKNPKEKPEEKKPEKMEQENEKEEPKEEKPVQENKERCWFCKRKCGINGIECKCGYVYCSKHRLPESHECQFDHKELAKKNNTKKLENGHT